MKGNKLTEDFVFELGKVTIGGDAVKVEEPPKEDDKKEEDKKKKDGDKQTSSWEEMDPES